MTLRLRHLARTAFCVLAGSLLGGVALIGTLASSAPAMPSAFAASAKITQDSCSSHHVNVQGYDEDLFDASYGNQGDVYVSTSGTLGGLDGPIARSLFIVSSTGDDVEVGWAAGPDTGSPMDEPTLYAEWVNDGVDSTAQYDGSIDTNTNYVFDVENEGGVGVWRFKFDGGNPFNYSPTMNFNYGTAITNSEHFESCDSLWAHFYNLKDEGSIDNWDSAYFDYECWSNNSINDWYFNRSSNSESYVTQTPGVTC
jgi:hypothetical protein